MSGSTLLSVEREHYKLLLSTPNISFEPHPLIHHDPQQEFHNKARVKFEHYIQDVTPKLDSLMAELINESPDRFRITRYTPQATELDDYNREALTEQGVTHCQARLSALSSVPGVLSDVSVYLTFHAIPSKAVLSELAHVLKEFLDDFKNPGDPFGLS